MQRLPSTPGNAVSESRAYDMNRQGYTDEINEGGRPSSNRADIPNQLPRRPSLQAPQLAKAPSSPAEYEQHLKQWVDTAPFSEMKARKTAVERIRVAFKASPFRRSVKLDLESLGLTSLPRLPISITHLAASNNELTGLPALPKGLKTLDVQNNLLITLPLVPKSLGDVLVSGNWPLIIPHAIISPSGSLKGHDLNLWQQENLDLVSPLNDSPNFEIFPTTKASIPRIEYKQELYRWFREGSLGERKARGEVAALFSRAYDDCNRILHIDGESGANAAQIKKLRSLPVWPRQLKGLSLKSIDLRILSTLPSTLNNLVISDMWNLRQLPRLPPGLISLSIYGARLSVLPRLPASLEVLNIRGIPDHASLPELPASLKSLSWSVHDRNNSYTHRDLNEVRRGRGIGLYPAYEERGSDELLQDQNMRGILFQQHTDGRPLELQVAATPRHERGAGLAELDMTFTRDRLLL